MTAHLFLQKVVGIGLGLMIAGCTDPPAREDNTGSVHASQSVPNARVIVAGIDRTGSYTLANAGRAQVARLLQTARPGDKWFVRWIQEKSYSDSAIIFTLSLPDVPAKPINPFDAQAKAIWAAKMNEVNRLKQQATHRIIQLNPDVARVTDIWGFFAKAAELLADTSSERERLIVIASDLCDTEHKRVPLNLKGVRVVVLAFQSGDDPAKTAALKQVWRKTLEQAGASVRFVDVSESPEETLQP